jgi:glycosyltransferase involved in cell wall biosynthesis
LDYRPNIDAVCWFGREVWPGIYRRHPQARFTIVGRQPAAPVRSLAAEAGIELVGQVADVRPFVHRAAVVVAPLRIARGVQNKVLEAMAMGKATIGSAQALEGLKIQVGVDVLAAATPQEWQQTILCLLDDGSRRRQLGLAGRRYVETHHQWDRCLQPLELLLGLSGATIGGSSPLQSAKGI